MTLPGPGAAGDPVALGERGEGLAALHRGEHLVRARLVGAWRHNSWPSLSQLA